MLVLFCSSVLLKDPDVVPLDEAIFYVFAAVRVVVASPHGAKTTFGVALERGRVYKQEEK